MVSSLRQQVKIIRNRHLEVRLLLPGSGCDDSRFSRMGTVAQVTDSAGNTYLGRESGEDGDYTGPGGIGLACEFCTAEPWGYGDALPGQKFLKPGVGTLIRPDSGDYSFFNNYRFVPFETEFSLRRDGAGFVQRDCRLGDIVFTLSKEILLQGDSLVIANELRNDGGCALTGDEYCHNFLSFGGRGIVPGLEFDCEPFFEPDSAAFPAERKERGGLRFTGSPEESLFGSAYLSPPLSEASWAVRDWRSGLGVGCREGFPVSRIALWGTSSVFSPEAYLSFSIAPGESIRWSREYRFGSFRAPL